jgi:poly-gamma-glutamate synthesis protein (capsule biosynthesis protein)
VLAFVGDYLPDADFRRVGAWQSDVIVANLETTIVESASVLRSKAYSVYLGPEAYERIARSGVAAFNVANNHVYDAGRDVFARMLARLGEIPGIQLYGLRERPYATISVGGMSCAVIGCLEPCRARGPALFPEEDVAALIGKLSGSHDRVYVTPHWGKEGELAFHPGPHQLALARRWVDAGASGIFGHHPHTIHGFESIRGVPVAYSLGNYQFDHSEGREHPAAAWGLVARVDPADGRAPVDFEFFLQAGGFVVPASEDSARLLRGHFARISEELRSVASSWPAWSRVVGPVYLSKCQKSWGRRWRSAPWRTGLLWAAWNCVPRTALCRMGAILRDRQASLYRDQVNQHLLRAQASTWPPA